MRYVFLFVRWLVKFTVRSIGGIFLCFWQFTSDPEVYDDWGDFKYYYWDKYFGDFYTDFIGIFKRR